MPATTIRKDIYEVIVSSICEFKLKEKVMNVSIDDSDGFYTADMKRFKREVKPMFNGVFFHTKCACHMLNSMVKSILDYVAPVVTKFEKLCAYAFYYHAKEFRKFLRGKGAKFSSHIGLHIEQDWNTTYDMLGRMVKQKPLLVEFYATCGDNESDSDNDSGIDIDDNDWENIESLLGILKVFRSSTIRLSNAYYPTTPLVLEEILLLTHMFKEYKQKPFWEPGILGMQSKLLQYYETMPEVFTCAAALNPKIGLNGVENILEDIEGYLGLDTSNDYAKASMRKCYDALHEMFDYYEKMCRGRGGERDMIMESGSRNIIMESVSRKDSRSVVISNELELYKKTDFLNVMRCDEYEDFDILEWWRSKGRYQYPILAEMARDLLSVQASTLALEFAFGLNGRVLDEPTTYKMSLLSSPKWYEVRVFLKEHFDASDQGKEKVKLVEDGEESEDLDWFSDSSDEEMS
ncbi:unnamed protein product [Lactuca saligna]|uniref:HAT C-terminal dimerisation domain-containing protein n=1 Tax=Lactuca saligna TaxID=75948 RepID=A0AA35ZLT4_LACSI|nr:unnamed protein product [Lactuca saligna]